MKWHFGATACTLLSACAPVEEAREPELRDVVQAALGALAVDEAPIPPPSEETLERVEGLLSTLTDARGRMRDVALADVRELGAGAVPVLTSVFSDANRTPAQHVAATELLEALDHPAAAEVLVKQLESAPEAWHRRYCAYSIGRTTQDQVVPRLLLRLKYEKDHETVVWIAAALARFQNYSGAQVLLDISATGGTEEVRALAASELAKVVAETELQSGETLRDAWRSERAVDLPQAEPSPRLRRALWTLVSALSEEQFQLRGVDDARFVLSRLGPWAIAPLAEALSERDFHVRLCSAQVLERMGRRAARAEPALVRALDDTRLAPAAAEALGRVGAGSATSALLERVIPGGDHELRVASMRALGRIGSMDALDRVRTLFDDVGEPSDLRLAAATTLVALGEGGHAATWLVGELTNEQGDAAGAELALDGWLRRVAGPALETWDTRAGPPEGIPSAAEAAERRRLRAQELRPRLAEIVSSSR